MKFRFLSVLGLAMVVCLASAIQAQEEGRGQRGQGGPGGQRGGGGFGGGGFGGGGFGGFGGGRGGPQMGGALELMGLLRIDEVRKEINLEDEVWQVMQEQGGRIDFAAMRDASESEREKILKDANDKAQALLDEVLDPAQLKRLMGLLAQQNGIRAVTNELIAKEIGLDAAGMKKVQEALDKASEEMREKMRESFAGARGAGGGGDQAGGRGGFNPEAMAKMREDMEKMRKESDDKVAASSLTDDQKKKFEELKGEKFDFPERTFGGPGGPGGRGGPGGGPGGRGGPGGGPGGRRGGDNNN